ncbi:hypothetical protein E4T38_04795 [Aureobasidium subglaciale]|nr:hypothetical protein E4T38_04795 [Aureobasidium subglaciale]KAI5223133.1 hypothetical protein E4T40_04608 [Aureobasidium subglaciale]KAI5226744.1 hypothetical protein E4T41_04551 [Aureobasidium subglaciale]KAI5262448.1 hypothetical protein E4T46_04437 [Aureobasidium subglaciale]
MFARRSISVKALPTTTSFVQTQLRCLHAKVAAKDIPKPTPFVPDAQTFLTLIGRKMSQHAQKIPDWTALFSLSSLQLRELGVEPARSRRYLLHWRNKFRQGSFGIGGDLTDVQDGVGELRIVEVPAASGTATLTSSPGMRKIIVNVPAGQDKPSRSLDQIKPVQGTKVIRSNIIGGPSVEAIKEKPGAAKIVAKEGLWEIKRGHKIDGGERRKAEVRYKRRVEERKTTRGALIFWAYIAAALGFTGVVLKTIRQSYLQNGRPKIPQFLIILAVSSFATLSYHMLSVLILSYRQWTSLHAIPLGALIGSNRTPLHLWRWSTTSSLFQGFGEAIVANKFRWFLSSSGLWSTLAVAIYMGIEGRRCKVPNLWAFFALLEILPTSFTQSLFYIMLFTKPRSANSNDQLLSYWPFWYSVPLLYNYCLRSASEYADDGEWLIYTILAARLLLILPLVLPLNSLGSLPPGTKSNTLQQVANLPLATFTMAIQFFAQKSGDLDVWENTSSLLLEALNSHPAVKTLSYDLGHAVVAFFYWSLRREKVELVHDVTAEVIEDEPAAKRKSANKKRR